MPKHNNAVQRPHLRKNWQPFVKTFFDQAGRKKRRLTKRRAKASAVFPRPIQRLRAIVRKCTQRYSSQTRLGRGFTLAEIKKVGLNPKFAQSIGIAVDHRRTNKSVETLQANVSRLESYLDKLVLLPRKEGKPKKGNNGILSDSNEKTELVQNTCKTVLPLNNKNRRQKPSQVTKEMNEFRAHSQIRIERMNKKWAGKRALRNKKDEN